MNSLHSSLCNGCSQLQKKKPAHSILDYADPALGQADILILTDSYRWGFGPDVLSPQEANILFPLLDESGLADSGYSIELAPAVKCPFVKEADMTAKDLTLCREHTIKTVEKVKPRLIICLGNLAFRMLSKKRGITDKRGNKFDYDGIPVIPTFHPFRVEKNASDRDLVLADFRNALMFLRSNGKQNSVPYETINLVSSFLEEQKRIQELKLAFNDAKRVPYIAIDIETTGFDFEVDRIRTIGLSFRDMTNHGKLQTIVLNIDGFVSPNPFVKNEISTFLTYIFRPDFGKRTLIMHNAKFDLKFLYQNFPELLNSSSSIYCTKILAKAHDENKPNSLRDLVKEHFGVIF